MVTHRNLNAIQIISPFLKVRICYVIGSRKNLVRLVVYTSTKPFWFYSAIDGPTRIRGCSAPARRQAPK